MASYGSITPSNSSKLTTGKTPQQWWSEMGNGGSPQKGGKPAPMNAYQTAAMNKAYNQQAQQEQYESARVAAAEKGLTNKVAGTKSKTPTNATLPGQPGFGQTVRTVAQPQGNQQQAFQGNINPYAQYADSVPRTGEFGGQQSQPTFMPSQPFGTNANPWGGGQQPTFSPPQQANPQAGGKRGVPTNRDTPYEAYEKDEAGDAIQYGPDGRRKMKSQVMPVLAPGRAGVMAMPKGYNSKLDEYGDPLARPGQYKHPAFPDEWESDEAYDARQAAQKRQAAGPPGTVRAQVVQDQYGKPIPQFPFSGNQNVPQSTFTAQYGNMNGGYSSQPNYGQRDAFIQNINDTTAGYQANQGTYLGQGAPPPTWGQAPQYNVPQMWQQAGNMVSNGWQNPLSGLFQQ